jgi:hypothetical protein
MAFALFLVIFSFDVFGEGKSAAETVIAFIIHNIPSMALGLLVFVAWRREWIGALTCLVLAMAYLLWSWGRFPVSVYFIMTGPLIIVAALYGANWRLRHRSSNVH